MKAHDIAIVGLGIVGASAAYAATRAGARVVALDAGVAGEGTSGTSFAWLNSVRKEPEAYHRLNADGMAAHRELARELGAAAGHHVGASTHEFLSPLGVSIPVGRVPGLLAVTSPPAQSLRRVVHAPGIHLRPEAGGGLVLGADDVDAPAAEARSASRLDELAALLLERAGCVMPAVRGVKVVDRRVGVRPMPADRHTIAGRIPGLDNAWLIATHSGVTLGPLLGRLIAEEIVDGTSHAALAPFRPERFATAS